MQEVKYRMDFFKSSRFWLSIVILVGIFGLALLGRISGQEAVASAMGLLAGFGVAKSGSIKSTSKTTTLLLPLLLLVASCSNCALTLSGKIDKTNQAIDALSKATLPIFNKACLSKAAACAEKKIKSVDCKEWQTCDASRMIFDKALDSAQIFCSSAYAMSKMSKTSDAKAWLLKSMEQLNLAYDALKKAEVIK